MADGAVSGYTDPLFQPVADAFAENFRERGELGASLAIAIEGETVVDLWGGLRSEGGEAWREDTVSVIFSATKGATALCAHLLIDRGAMALATPVVEIWPEYGAHGKAATTVAMLLDHSAGVPAFHDPLKPDGPLDWDYMVARLEAEPPFWPPGTRHGYHGLNFGWTVGELVRRLSGKSLGGFFQDEIARPLGLDFWIGTPAEIDPRIAPIETYKPPRGQPLTPFVEAILHQPGSPASCFMRDAGAGLSKGYASRVARAAEIPAANGISNGRGLARMYAPLANQGAGLVSPDTVRAMARCSAASHQDATLMIPTRFAAGFMTSMDNRARGFESAILGEAAFGHVGAGGSIGFADPDCRMSLGYTMNRRGPSLLLNPRGQALVDATYRCLNYRSNSSGAWSR